MRPPIRLRRRLEATGEQLALRVWGFPWLSRVTLGGLVLVVTAMGLLPETRPQLLISLVTMAVVLGLYQIRLRHGPDPASYHVPLRE
ncbi:MULTISPECIES: hypothetical protein [unclassified Luteococcus]|uniref:hypothetical protein n=1 Tax=unclassified Luteococcus TaxID=2639923 RepID=UPI00313F38BA